MALTSLATIKSRLGITDNTQDVLLQALIDSATKAIENYCDRTFEKADYFEQGYSDGHIYLKNTPIHTIYACMMGDQNAIQIDYNGTFVFSVNVDREKVTLFENFSNTTYSFATYTNISELNAQINLHANASSQIVSSVYNNWPSKYLWQGHSTLGEDANIFLEMPTMSANLLKINEGMYGTQVGRYMIFYSGGYDTIPADLTEICNRIVISLYSTKTKDGSLQSESIGDYSYTNRDFKQDASSLLFTYANALNNYRIKVL